MLLRKGIHFATNSNDRDRHFWCSDFSDFNDPTFPIDRGRVGLWQSGIRRHLTNIYQIVCQNKYLKPSNYLILFRSRLLVNSKYILSRCPRKFTLYRDLRDRALPYYPPSCGKTPGFTAPWLALWGVRVDRILAAMSQDQEFCVFISHEQKRQVIFSIFTENYHPQAD